MHHTRKTHNAHNETQRRFAKVKNVWWLKAPVSHSKKDVNDAFYTEHKGSRKALKRGSNRFFRRNKIASEINIVNKKVLNFVCDEWGFI